MTTAIWDIRRDGDYWAILYNGAPHTDTILFGSPSVALRTIAGMAGDDAARAAMDRFIASNSN